MANAQVKHFETPYLSDIVRDKTGRIWGNSTDEPNNGLYTWGNGQWNKVDFGPVSNFAPIQMTQRPDGTVICLWRSDQPSEHQPTPTPFANNTRSPSTTPTINSNLRDYKVSEHRGSSSRFIAAFTAELDETPIIVATQTDVWITRGGREIYRLGTSPTFKPAYRIGPQQFFRVGKPDELTSATNPLRAVTDGQGHLWFFSDVWWYGSRAYLLRGVVIWDGQRFSYHPNPAKPASKFPLIIETLAPKDANHLWIAVGDKGLYELDIHSFVARHVTPPSPKAFAVIQQITSVGRNWCVVAGSRWGDGTEYDQSMNTGHLWQLRDGQWHLLLSGLDTIGGSYSWGGPQETPRPFLETPQGLWIGAFGNGAWFVPSSPKSSPPKVGAIHVDWRCGLHPTSVDRFCALNHGQIMVHGGAIAALFTDVPALLRSRAAANVTTFRTYCNLVQDSKGHIWGARSLAGRALNEWNGLRWLTYPVPRDYHLFNASECAVDGQGRIWILPDSRDGQTAIYDSPYKKWQVFANYRLALQAQLRLAQLRAVGQKGSNAPGVALALPQFNLVQEYGIRNPRQVPDCTDDGRICYLSLASKLCYFDGKVWHQWTRAQITGEPTPPPRYLWATPFFDRSGKLCVNVDNKTWKLTSPTGIPHWQSYPLETDPRPAAQQSNPTQVAPPPGTSFSPTDAGSSPPSPASIIRDGKGFVWIIWKGQLYKTLPGLQATQFAANENQPFLNERTFDQVFVDNVGNTFFWTPSGFDEYVMLRASHPPDTKIKVIPRTVDDFTFVFSSPHASHGTPASATEPQWFKWRMDDDPWSEPQSSSQIRLDTLPGGRHRLAVAAINRALISDPTPARAVFLVNIDPNQQVAGFIADLASPDYARREKAVNGLTKQPQRALSALKAARARATPDTQWWIDAAIQQIGSDARRKKARSESP